MATRRRRRQSEGGTDAPPQTAPVDFPDPEQAAESLRLIAVLMHVRDLEVDGIAETPGTVAVHGPDDADYQALVARALVAPNFVGGRLSRKRPYLLTPGGQAFLEWLQASVSAAASGEPLPAPPVRPMWNHWRREFRYGEALLMRSRSVRPPRKRREPARTTR